MTDVAFSEVFGLSPVLAYEAGYYDRDTYLIGDWLKGVEGLPNITGAMYTTWKDDYDDMESWARATWGGGASDGPPK